MPFEFLATLRQELYKSKTDQEDNWKSKVVLIIFFFRVMQLKADVSKYFKPHFYISAIKASFLYAVNGYNIVVASALQQRKDDVIFQWIPNTVPFTSATLKQEPRPNVIHSTWHQQQDNRAAAALHKPDPSTKRNRLSLNILRAYI